MKFYGYQNEKAIAVRNQLNCWFAVLFCSAVSLIASILFLVYRIYYGLFIWVVPLLFLICSFIVRLCEKSASDVKMDLFEVEEYRILKNGREMKDVRCSKVYVFSEFLFFATKEADYIIPNEEIIGCDRDRLVRDIRKIARWKLGKYFQYLPDIREEEKVKLLHRAGIWKSTLHAFYTEDNRKRILVFRNRFGSYSYRFEILELFDREEARWSQLYGMWIPYRETNSFFESESMVLKEIEGALNEFHEEDLTHTSSQKNAEDREQ